MTLPEGWQSLALHDAAAPKRLKKAKKEAG